MCCREGHFTDDGAVGLGDRGRRIHAPGRGGFRVGAVHARRRKVTSNNPRIRSSGLLVLELDCRSRTGLARDSCR